MATCENCDNSGTYCPLCWPSKLAGWESDAIDPRDAEIAALKATIASGEQAWIVVQKHPRHPSIVKAWGAAQAFWTFNDHDAAVRFLGHGVLPSLRDAYEVREVSVTILPREVNHG